MLSKPVSGPRMRRAAVVIAQGAEVQLLVPAFFGVEAAEEQHHERGELGLLLRRRVFPPRAWAKIARRLFVRAGRGGAVARP